MSETEIPALVLQMIALLTLSIYSLQMPALKLALKVVACLQNIESKAVMRATILKAKAAQNAVNPMVLVIQEKHWLILALWPMGQRLVIV